MNSIEPLAGLSQQDVFDVFQEAIGFWILRNLPTNAKVYRVAEIDDYYKHHRNQSPRLMRLAADTHVAPEYWLGPMNEFKDRLQKRHPELAGRQGYPDQRATTGVLTRDEVQQLGHSLANLATGLPMKDAMDFFEEALVNWCLSANEGDGPQSIFHWLDSYFDY